MKITFSLKKTIYLFKKKTPYACLHLSHILFFKNIKFGSQTFQFAGHATCMTPSYGK